MDTTERDAADQADMQRLAAGHETALDALMERHAAGVFRFLFRMLESEEDANDLAQETFLRVFRAKGSYRPEMKFTTWLFTIAANLGRNQLRWRARHPNISADVELEPGGGTFRERFPASGPGPGHAAELAERTAAVRAAVHELPGELREAIVLCEWEELAVAEAAAILRTTPKAVESRLYRARRLLRETLRRWL